MFRVETTGWPTQANQVRQRASFSKFQNEPDLLNCPLEPVVLDNVLVLHLLQNARFALHVIVFDALMEQVIFRRNFNGIPADFR